MTQLIDPGEWIRTREPAPPPALRARLEELTESRPEVARDAIADALVARATHVLAHLGEGREAALDLLAADALITYAMEAASDAMAVDESATRAMHVIAAAGQRVTE